MLRNQLQARTEPNLEVGEALPTLGSLEPWQAEIFLAHLNQVRGYLRSWVSFASKVYDLADARKLLQEYADALAQDRGRLYGIWLGSDLIGGTMFRLFDAKALTCEVGVWIDPEYAGRGIVSAAATEMFDWAVQERGIERIEWICDVENARSRQVAQRMGMTLEGVHRSLFELEGKRRDMEVWAMLGQEWREYRELP